MDSIALHIDINPIQPWSEIAVTWLVEEGCNAFEENTTGIVAYADASDINQDEIIIKIESWAKTNDIEVKVKSELIPHQNWNAKWESDFHPVEVGHLLFLDHLCFQVVSPHLHELTLLVKVIHRPIRVPDSDQDSSMFGLRGRLTLNGFSKLHHLQ